MNHIKKILRTQTHDHDLISSRFDLHLVIKHVKTIFPIQLSRLIDPFTVIFFVNIFIIFHWTNTSSSSITKQAIAVIRNTVDRAISSVSFIMGSNFSKGSKEGSFSLPSLTASFIPEAFQPLSIISLPLLVVVSLKNSIIQLACNGLSFLKRSFTCTSSNETLLANCLVSSAEYH